MENRDFSESPGANEKPRAKATFPADQLTVNDWVGAPLIGRVPYLVPERYSSLRDDNKEDEGKRDAIVEEEEEEIGFFTVDEALDYYFDTRARYKEAEVDSDEWVNLREELNTFDIGSERHDTMFDARVRCDVPYIIDVKKLCKLVKEKRLESSFRRIGGLANGSMCFGWSIESRDIESLIFTIFVYTDLDDGEEAFEMVEFESEDKEGYVEFKQLFEVIATCVVDLDRAAAEKTIESNRDKMVQLDMQNQELADIVKEGWK